MPWVNRKGPKPIEENPLDRLASAPHLAGDAVEKTWSFVWPSVSPKQAAEQAARLAAFFDGEVLRLEAL